MCQMGTLSLGLARPASVLAFLTLQRTVRLRSSQDGGSYETQMRWFESRRLPNAISPHASAGRSPRLA